MLQKGRIDLLLARPVNRSTILLYKYLGGLLYAGITGAVFVGGSFLVLSARSGVWNWGYLMSLGTLVVFFAVLSSIGVLTAVLTRNTVATILVPLAAWGVGFLVTGFKNTGRNPLSFFKTPPWADSALEGLSWFVPRASDFNRMNAYFMQKYAVGDEVAELIKAQHHLPDIAWIPTLVSSALMIVVMLTGACWIFSRRDH
jgi:ABC-type transport system involved in multi-copper enzyme maturation permease subunit